MSLPLPVHSRSAEERKPLSEAGQVWAWGTIAGLIAICVLVYLDSLRLTYGSWGNPQYSHGFLIPIFAAVLLWMKREPFREVTMVERWCGVALVIFAMIVRVVSAHYTTFTTDNLSLIPCLLGVFLLVGGWRSLKWAALPIAFLVFMYPWPDRLESLILVQLKERVAMPVSLFSLQTLGVEAYLSGNIIELGEGTRINVVAACAGLGMLNIFLALAAAFAMIVTWRPIWERIVLFVSAVPIALAANSMRITGEGLIYYYGERLMAADTVNWAAAFFHDHLASWFMMVVALGLLYLEYQILRRVVLEDDEQQTLSQHLPSKAAAK